MLSYGGRFHMEVSYIIGGVKPVTGKEAAAALGITDAEDPLYADLTAMAEEAAAVAVPKAVYIKAELEEAGQGYIVIGGVRFDSELLRKNTEHSPFVVVYNLTCGRELHEWSKKYQGDPLLQYASETIMERYLRLVGKLMHDEVREKYFKGKVVSSMAPGSLADWPITQQRKLFALLGENAEMIGVELTDSCLMIPKKSGSGIYFYSDEHFESCMLCTRQNCPNRRAKYRGPAAQ